jgi:hypothetical protein
MRNTPDYIAKDAEVEARIFRTCSMHLRGTEAVALSVSENVPRVSSRYNIHKAYQCSNQNGKASETRLRGEDSTLKAEGSTTRDEGLDGGSKAIKLSLIRRLHTNSNAGLVSIRDVYNAVDELLS